MKKQTKKKSKGLGDTVAFLTELTKLDKLAKKLSKLTGKEDCGCERRREKLNDIFPYDNKQE